MFHDISFRLRAVFRRSGMEAELDEEIRAHLEHQAEKLMRGGLSREEADKRARFDFGDLEQVKDECRRSWGVRLVDELAAELRTGLRQARRKPVYSTVFALALFFGLLANTMMFDGLTSVVERLSPRPHAANPALVAQNSVSPPPPVNKSDALPVPAVRKNTNKKLSRARITHRRDQSDPERLASATCEKMSIVTAAYFYAPGPAQVSAANWIVNDPVNPRNDFVLISRTWRQAGPGARLEALEVTIRSGDAFYRFVEVISGNPEYPQQESWKPLVLRARAAMSNSAHRGALAVTKQSGQCSSISGSLSNL